MSAPTSAPVAAPALTAAIGRFVQSPPDIARYDTDLRTAAIALRTDERRIAELAEAGLPHRQDAVRGPMFDYDDLTNVGFFCATGQTTPELGLRFLMRFAASSPDSWFAARDWSITVRPVPRLERDGAGPAPAQLPVIRVRRPDLTAAGVGVVPGAEPTVLADDGYDLLVRLTGSRQQVVDPRVRPVWEQLLTALADGSVRYQTVPEGLRADPRRAWSMGIADCVVASRVLAGRLRRLGLDARVRRGYLLGLFGSDHSWCELHEDGVTKPLDPVFAHFARNGDAAKGIRRSPEFAEACFGSRFNRLLPCVGDDGAPLVHFDGRPAPYWAMVGVSARPWSGR